MHKTILFAVTALLGATVGAGAAALGSDYWTESGHAWSRSRDYQPFFETGRIIVADDRSDFAQGHYGELESSVGPGWLVNHLTGHSFYAGLTPVDFTLTPKQAFAGTQVIRLSVLLSFGFHEKPTLTVTGVNGGTTPLFSETVTPSNDLTGDIRLEGFANAPSDVVDQPLELYVFSWTLDHPLGSEDAFYLNFGINRYASITSVILTQEAVPEPAVYALLAGAFGLAAVVVARRRRRV